MQERSIRQGQVEAQFIPTPKLYHYWRLVQCPEREHWQKDHDSNVQRGIWAYPAGVPSK